jgi:hypothetical protein
MISCFSFLIYFQFKLEGFSGLTALGKECTGKKKQRRRYFWLSNFQI